ncbi:hypothetical protein SAMN02745830_04847 [Streptomyces sp. Amel2xC10]|nr:hypothetical protein SAMN02745830_04847 [Streptomyces sp. Amel2xC10]
MEAGSATARAVAEAAAREDDSPLHAVVQAGARRGT